ncbi:MAG: hypothetical protein LUI39_06475 [Lachnospiraceae bacterium]|nr:hypothetical protein [Lachnospiraceae bacterium]
MTPEQALGNAIIIQAVKDYRMALRTLKKNPDCMSAKDTRREIEQFFRSQWYMMLTDVDGEFLIQKLNEEVSSK